MQPNVRPGLLRNLSVPETTLLGLQWFAIGACLIVVLGNVCSRIHGLTPEARGDYILLLFSVTGLALALQVRFGHRLPILCGPAAVMVVGVTLTSKAGMPAVYTGVMVGGLALAAAAALGWVGHFRKLFNLNVIAVVLLLIGVLLSPTIWRLANSNHGTVNAAGVTFFAAMLGLMFVGNRFLPGALKTTMVVWFLILGALTYQWLPMPPEATNSGGAAAALEGALSHFSWDWSVVVTFLFCYLALLANDVGAVQTVEPLLHPRGMEKRTGRAALLTGLADATSAALGVIGPVNYALSPGVILTSNSASVVPLYVAAALLLATPWIPGALPVLAAIPAPVVGAILAYVVVAQMGFGVLLATRQGCGGRRWTSLVLRLGVPVILGGAVAFMPADFSQAVPTWLQPLLGNGFVVGTGVSVTIEKLLDA